ncbi:MAG: small VCP/p97-interacting protein [Thermoplasmata archaeon]
MAPILTPKDDPKGASDGSSSRLDPETRRRLEAVAEEKRRAREEPGPSWHDWLYFQAFKWWLVIVFLILDSWVTVQLLEMGAIWAIAPALAASVYAEYLLYACLWYRPDPEEPRRRRGVPFRRSLWRPVEMGRWTPERALRDRQILAGDPGLEGVDPDEFL